MYKESEVNLDDIVKALLESELGFLLLQSDNNCKNMYDVLSEKSTYEDRIGMFGYNTHITYHLFPLTYHTHKNESDVAKARVQKNIIVISLDMMTDAVLLTLAGKKHIRIIRQCMLFLRKSIRYFLRKHIL